MCLLLILIKKTSIVIMNPESLLKTVALNKYVKCFLNKNASKHPRRQKNTFISNCLIIVRSSLSFPKSNPSISSPFSQKLCSRVIYHVLQRCY